MWLAFTRGRGDLGSKLSEASVDEVEAPAGLRLVIFCYIPFSHVYKAKNTGRD